jgi:hypothetical protein
MRRSIDWESHIKSQASSGLSAREYCRKAGISDSSFSGWRRKLSEGKVGNFVDLTPEAGRLEVWLKSGVRISVPTTVSEQNLKKVKELVELLND